ncbi:hypothetical protein CFR80_16970 [Komagataeibacter oboediens]|uniref:Uncharacterized protein n=1 Tax=Komagataeibacter oboediens TaxID=65958 RepID=A0A318QYH9_9PROT|nr:hypothetical protein CFR80_16970 [Komagataeibacter oboediens]
MWLSRPTMEEPVEKRIADLEAKVEELMARKETHDSAIEMEVEIINRLVDMVALLIFHQPPSVKRDVLNAWAWQTKQKERNEQKKKGQNGTMLRLSMSGRQFWMQRPIRSWRSCPRRPHARFHRIGF